MCLDGDAAAARPSEDKEAQEQIRAPSVESALQMKEALTEERRAKDAFLSCDTLSELPFRAMEFAVAKKRAGAALGVIEREAGLMEHPAQLRKYAVTTVG